MWLGIESNKLTMQTHIDLLSPSDKVLQFIGTKKLGKWQRSVKDRCMSLEFS